MPPYPHFVGGSYQAQSDVVMGALSMNCYVEQIEVPGAPAKDCLLPIHGVESFGTTTDSPGRAHFEHEGRAFAVIGAQFLEYDSGGAVTIRGTVVVDSNPATICTNGDGGGQVFVTSGGNGYLFDLTSNVFTQVRTGATTMGAHLDGYFLALDAATSTVYLSDLLDGATWDPTQFAQRSIRPDGWVSMKVLDRFIWLFGSKTSEVWYDSGAFPFPFAPHPSGLVAYGCSAPFSPRVVADAICWLAGTDDGPGQVMRASGFQPEAISTHALQSVFADFSTIEDAIGDAYQDTGHTFYVLTFPTANKTVAYDVSTGLWSDRGTWIAEGGRFDAWRPLYHVVAFGRHLVLDRGSGTIYHMHRDASMDVDGRVLRIVRRPPALWQGGASIPIGTFALDMEVGLGLTTGQGSNPLVSLRASKDGGKTFGSERFRSTGARGEYAQRVEWTRCGDGRHWQPEIVFTEPVPFRVFGARYAA
jgi:hypothetical protein